MVYGDDAIASKSRDDLEPDAFFGESDDVIGYIGDLFDTTYGSWTVTINGEEYTYSSDTLKDANGEEVTELEAGTYTVVLSLAGDYEAWSDGTTEDISYTFEVYALMTSSTPTDPDALFGDSSTVIGYIEGLFDTTDSSWTVTINGEEYTYTESKLYDADGEEVTSLEAGTYTVVLSLAGEYEAWSDGSWGCTAGTKLSFTLAISLGDCDGYSFDYWYGEDGTHVSDAMDEFLGEEKVSFTEESLLGLNLYYVTGTVTTSGGSTTEVVYVYLLDPVYGTVCVYQLEVGDTFNGDTISEIDTAYTNTFKNVSYYGEEDYEGKTFEDALGIYFYESTDYIGEDGIILSEDDEGYNDDDNLFSSILEGTDCASGAIAIGYFECANCGMKVPVYASAAHTFIENNGVDTGLDMEAPKTDSGRATYNWTDAACTPVSDWNWNGTAYTGAELPAGTEFFENQDEWYTVSAVYTYDGTAYEAACVVSADLKVETYTVTLTLISGYTWADGTDGTKTFTFINYPEDVTATAPTEPTALYGETDDVIGYIGDLFADAGSWTVTINGEEYTLDGTTLTDANGDEVETLEVGTYTVVLSLAGDYEVWSDGTTEDITYTFTVYAGLVTEPTDPDALYGTATDVNGYLEKPHRPEGL